MEGDKAVILKKKVIPSPMLLLEMAVQGGSDIETIERLQAMSDKWQKEQARKEFLKALSNFQSVCPVIEKKSKVEFGGSVKYTYANLATIISTIKNALKESKLSYRWETDDKGESITITCILGHVDGHEERNTMSAKADDSGKKNDIQARGSTISYLQRYTLVGSLGIGTADTDDDGKTGGKNATTEEKLPELKTEYLKLIKPFIEASEDYYKKLLPKNWHQEETIQNYIKAIVHVKGLDLP